MTRIRFLVGSSLLLAVAGFTHAADDRVAKLDAMYAEFWEENLVRNPLLATQAGDPRYNAELPNNLSAEYEAATRAFHQKYLDRARKIGTDGLTGQDRLSYEIFTLNRESALEDLKYPGRLMPVNQFRSFATTLAQLGSGTGSQPFKTVKDYDDWLKRAALAPAILDQSIANMREGVKARLTQPRVLMEKVLPQLDANIVDDAQKSIFWGPVKNFPAGFPAADRERLTAAFRELITKQIDPALRRLRAFIAD